MNGTITENEARYIVRMLDAFKENVLFNDSTDKDAELLDIMREKYREGGRWQAGSEAARSWLIMYVAENGVPGGDYFEPRDLPYYLARRGVPMIERPKGEVTQ